MKPGAPATDPAHDVLKYVRQPLDAIFSPQTVAVIGATEKTGSVGRTLLKNLVSHPFGGTVYPVNPARRGVLGVRAYPDIGSVPEPVDLAVIVTPAPTVPGIIGQCVDAGVKGAIIISAGFRETGAAGVRLEQQVLEQARRGKMRVIGPNCLGVMRPVGGLNATFASTMARPGNVGFISQSGALLTAILDWSLRENVGFSAFVSVGSMLDVNWGDLIDYLGDDPHTKSIVIYMESIGDARSFLSAAREVALSKPIIVIKAGRSAAAAKAAASHTGALTGSDEVLDAAFRRSGVLRVHNISDIFYLAEILAKQPRPRGPRLTILTNAGGPGVLATDALMAGGCELAMLSDQTLAALNEFLPAHWSRGNPVDILGDADPQRYARAVKIAAEDPNSDGLLVILTPQDMTDPTATAQAIVASTTNTGKPLLASWMGGEEVARGDAILSGAGIPGFAYPDSAARMFSYMWRYSYNLRSLYETPEMAAATVEHDDQRRRAQQIIDQARAQRRTLLTEVESKELLAAYDVPTAPTRVAASADEAAAIADSFGYPAVLKLFSRTITHKTDVGGVKLNLHSPHAVREAFDQIRTSVLQHAGADAFDGVAVQPMVKLDGYELILGSSIDPQFGPVLLFGAGGQLVEVFKDRALALPPLNSTLARRMMEQTNIYKALQGVRGRKPVDMAALQALLVRFSQLVVEQPWIKEIDINPLLVWADRFVALDARVLLHEPDSDPAALPRPVIQPYPSQYVRPAQLRDGTPVLIRPIRPEDEPLIVRFHKTLSERTVYMRYFNLVQLSQRVSHERLTRICFIDYDREIALVAETAGDDGARQIIGVGRLSKLRGGNAGEFAIIITDQFQGRGLGGELLGRLIQIARDQHLESLGADILSENRQMQRLCERMGFTVEQRPEEDVVRAEMRLTELPS